MLQTSGGGGGCIDNIILTFSFLASKFNPIVVNSSHFQLLSPSTSDVNGEKYVVHVIFIQKIIILDR